MTARRATIQRDDGGLATIGIPTFNRAAMLKRSVESALAQDYIALEVVIVDNCSVDQTAMIAREFARLDPRVRYIRQPSNVGAIANFEAALTNASGEFFMWLADDDVISSSYLSAGIEKLEAGGHVLVAGRPVWEGGLRTMDEHSIRLRSPRAEDRVLGYLREVKENSVFYGVARTSTLRTLQPFPRRYGWDWQMLLGLAMRGTVEVCDSAQLTRATSTATDPQLIAHGVGPGWIEKHLPRTALIRNMMRYLIFSRQARATWRLPTRLRIASRAGYVLWPRLWPHQDALQPLIPVLKQHAPRSSINLLRTAYHLILRVEAHIQDRMR